MRNGATHLTKPIAELKIPPTVQGILASRIDRLPADAKDLLQTLSVIGREFPMSLVRAVVPQPAEEIDRMLNDLQLGEFIYEQPAVGDTEYTFKHALTQEVAYNSVLQERRKLFHERIGAAVEALHTDRIEDHIANLARHYARSANAAKAVEYCVRACQQSSERASHSEAIVHFEMGLGRLQELPDDGQRAECELDLRNAAQRAVIATKGYGSAESEQLALRAFELSQRPGIDFEKSWRALNFLFVSALIRARVGRAREIATQLMAVAERSGDVNLIAESFFDLAFPQMTAGDFELAAEDLDRAISLCESPPLSIASLRWRRNLVHSHAYAMSAWNSWFLGFPDRALRRLEHAFQLARASDSRTVEEGFAASPDMFFLFAGTWSEPERLPMLQ